MTAAGQRLFFALWPDDAVRAEVLAATRKLVRRSGGRPVRPENLHVTLAFLGWVDAGRLAAASAAGATVSGRRFTLRLDRVEHFARSAVLALASAEPPAALLELARRLAAALASAGFELDVRPFRPHMTLARKVGRAPRGLAPQHAVSWPAGEFALVESVTDRDGAHYAVRECWPLVED